MSSELSPRAAKFLAIIVKLVESAEASQDVGTVDLLVLLGSMRRHELDGRFLQQPMPRPCWIYHDQFIHLAGKLRRAGGLADADLERLERAIETFAAERYIQHLATLSPDKARLFGVALDTRP